MTDHQAPAAGDGVTHAPDRALHVALRQTAPIPLDVAFSCAPGDVLGIFGPSGSGKTTILRTIAGLYAPRQAEVRIGSGVWVDTSTGVMVPAHERAVGLVFQEYALFPHLTALDNVILALGHRTRGERRARAEELLARVHLTGRFDRRPAALSGGERQRVGLARALARDPRVLLLDEPFAAVDRSVRRHLQDEIDALRRSLDIPLVLVTHDFDDVVRLATHVLVLQEGRVVTAGRIEEVTSHPALSWLRDAVGLGSVFDAVVSDALPTRGLLELRFDGGTLLAPHRPLPAGAPVRVRVPAREVILATGMPPGLSLHNALAGIVAAVHADADTDSVMVQLAIGRTRLLAEVTRDAVARLQVAEGQRLYALIKSVSLDVRAAQTAAVTPL
jgi:molybdate transport system ATP-binding protein